MSTGSPIASTERQLVGYYVHAAARHEERLSRQFFIDPIALTVMEVVEWLESEESPISIETVTGAIFRRAPLPTEPGVIIAEIIDPVSMEMPLIVKEHLEQEIRDACGRRSVQGMLESATKSLADGNGPNAVIEIIRDRLPVITSSLGPVRWPDMEELIVRLPEARYPLEHLPPLIRDAVSEVLGSAQVPTSLAVLSALSCASLCVQHLADIERDSHLVGPISLYGLIIAESGERKSACDNLFGQFIRDFQRSTMETAKPEISGWMGRHEIWKCQVDGLKVALRDAAKKNKDDSSLRDQIQQLISNEPKPPRVPDLKMENETPASLRVKLSYMNPRAWLSRALMTNEGGTIFGGHGMGCDTALDYLSTLNKLWDGGEISTGRRGDGDHHIAGARLTVGIAVQEPILRSFIDKSMARQCGYLARFLTACPESMRGSRPFRPAGAMPNLKRFGEKGRRFLEVEPSHDTEGRITPAVLQFDPAGKSRWVEFFNDTEHRQGVHGDLRSFSDVASKAADQAARLAGIFHFWAGESVAAPVAEVTVVQACRVAEWHLNELVRFLSSTDSHNGSDAALLEEWMREHCRNQGVTKVPRREIQQSGPKRLRDGRALDQAIAFLSEKKRARLVEVGKRTLIELHPDLLEFRRD